MSCTLFSLSSMCRPAPCIKLYSTLLETIFVIDGHVVICSDLGSKQISGLTLICDFQQQYRIPTQQCQSEESSPQITTEAQYMGPLSRKLMYERGLNPRTLVAIVGVATDDGQQAAERHFRSVPLGRQVNRHLRHLPHLQKHIVHRDVQVHHMHQSKLQAWKCKG